MTRRVHTLIRRDDRAYCLVAYGLLALWTLPLWIAPSSRGALNSDWDWFLTYFEAVRKSLMDYGHGPWNNVWNSLGSPLWANPQIGPLSHYGVLVLIFGTTWGLKLGIALHYFLSFECARALARHVFVPEQNADIQGAPVNNALANRHTAVVIAALLYALNTGISAHFTRGQVCFGAYAFVPLLVLWCMRAMEHRWAGLVSGGIAGVMVHYGIPLRARLELGSDDSTRSDPGCPVPQKERCEVYIRWCRAV